jgi:ABC-type nickel/cobalt efflux system permease component RcnA
VFAVGLSTLYASRFVSTEDLYVWLSIASGVLVVALGAMLLFSRLRAHLRVRERQSSHHHGHDHSHAHEHGHGHSHLPSRPGMRGLIALGVSGGLLPCPTALVIMLAAIALDRVLYGLILIVAFSFGLASVLMLLGLLVIYAKRALTGSRRLSRLAASPFVRVAQQAMPLMSSLAILVVGLLLTTRAVTSF